MAQPRSFTVSAVCGTTQARAGVIETPHGLVPTPVFMPVGTQGSVKSLAPSDIAESGTTIILGNTYHLYLRPGMDVISQFGGLHRFMAWDRPILTDSGGFQVFSLTPLRRITEDGVRFSSHIDGSAHFLSPETAIQYQEAIGSDIAMVLDVCHPHDVDAGAARAAMEQTHRWAVRCQEAHNRPEQALYAIVQGGVFPDLRVESARFLSSLGFPGYAIGGLSIGEPKSTTWRLLQETTGELPRDRPRYLMGVGAPDDIIMAVSHGVDMMDSVLPTRVARHGAVFTRRGRLNLRNSSFRFADDPVETGCDCSTCQVFSIAYLHHLFKSEELLGYRLATVHNLRFMARLMKDIREAIVDGTFGTLRNEFLEEYRPSDENTRIEQKKRWLMAKMHQPSVSRETKWPHTS